MRIYFSGIGGVGLGPLAEIAKGAGHEVLGSDVSESLTTKELQQSDIKLKIGDQDGSFLRAEHQSKPIDWLVYTAALTEDHPELQAAKEMGINTTKRDELLAQIISDKGLKLIAISGTHGKTTTTGMLIWLFKQLGLPISYSIGTTISFGKSGEFDEKSEYFIYEADEFDRNMLQFEPFLSLIPSLDHDHADTYPTEQDYLSAFAQFAAQSQSVITWSNQHAEIYSGDNVEFIEAPAKINLAGEHNRRNATLVLRAARKLHLEGNFEEILAKFPGTDRRMEKLADNLYSDYAHHPEEIEATLQAARELSDHLAVVYEPHQNIRQHTLKNEYTSQFELAEKVYWLPTYLSREDPSLEVLKPEELVQNLTNRDKVQIANLDENLWQKVRADMKDGRTVIFMGAGTIDGWVRDQLKR